MNMPDIKVYQIYFQPRQEPLLSKEFTPYLNKTSDDFYESGVFKKEFQKGTHLKSAYTGFVSWKFERKSFVSATDFLALIKEQPGRDVYFLNPFPELTGVFKNVWVQGAKSHSGLLVLAQRVFDEVGIKVSINDIRNDASNTLYCNYWYGSQKFWTEFMAFCAPFYELLEDKNSKFYGEVRASAQYHGGGTLIPFFMERLFSTFLALRPDITSHGFNWTPAKHLGILQPMRHQLNLCQAQLEEIAKKEEQLPAWKKWLLRI
jgi:hypothetical protein